MPSKECPLCKGIASFKQAQFGTANTCFTCPICNCFVMSPQAEKLLIDSPEQWKIKLSKQSKKAKIGEILLITVKVKNNDKEIISVYDKESKWT